MITKSPCETVSMPKREKKQRNYLRPDEYATLLSCAGSHPRDFAIRIKNCFLCDGKTQRNLWRCKFFQGYIKGAMSAIFDSDDTNIIDNINIEFFRKEDRGICIFNSTSVSDT